MSAVLAHSIIRSLALVALLLTVPRGTGWAATVEVYYAPEDAPLDRLAALYGQAKRYLYVAVYGLTTPRAVEAMIAAKKRGVDVRLITDRQRTEDVKQR
ncbi:MAG: phospholipase D-like domain-containing protein, partial [Nitrospirota bacterium]|nr:phospholipase D-like domain-containing protein [Nitrospirota bacterium]